jgi:hypothetical protein
MKILQSSKIQDLEKKEKIIDVNIMCKNNFRPSFLIYCGSDWTPGYWQFTGYKYFFIPTYKYVEHDYSYTSNFGECVDFLTNLKINIKYSTELDNNISNISNIIDKATITMSGMDIESVNKENIKIEYGINNIISFIPQFWFTENIEQSIPLLCLSRKKNKCFGHDIWLELEFDKTGILDNKYELVSITCDFINIPKNDMYETYKNRTFDYKLKNNKTLRFDGEISCAGILEFIK